MRKQKATRHCAVCNRSEDVVLARFRAVAWLCPIHDTVARGIIPAPTTVRALRALFPARVTVTPPQRRTRAA
jgi:hypothetical protein